MTIPTPNNNAQKTLTSPQHNRNHNKHNHFVPTSSGDNGATPAKDSGLITPMSPMSTMLNGQHDRLSTDNALSSLEETMQGPSHPHHSRLNSPSMMSSASAYPSPPSTGDQGYLAGGGAHGGHPHLDHPHLDSTERVAGGDNTVRVDLARKQKGLPRIGAARNLSYQPFSYTYSSYLPSYTLSYLPSCTYPLISALIYLSSLIYVHPHRYLPEESRQSSSRQWGGVSRGRLTSGDEPVVLLPPNLTWISIAGCVNITAFGVALLAGSLDTYLYPIPQPNPHSRNALSHTP